LTHRLWNRLGANRGIIGQPMRLNGEPYPVVGVLSPGLADRLGPELAVPLAFRPEQINHDYHWLLTMGRLRPGVTLQQAQADVDAVIRIPFLTQSRAPVLGLGGFKCDLRPKTVVVTLLAGDHEDDRVSLRLGKRLQNG
jgi:hypothetical protein